MLSSPSPAFHLIDGASSAAFVFCDHASHAVPDFVGDLRIAQDDRLRHIGWDIGSEAVTRGLCRALDCGGLICGFSRLVIDANRSPDSPGLIPEQSDGTPIPVNQGLSPQDRAARIDRLYTPYHAALGEALDARPGTLAISVHSFTPQLRGQPKRATDIGLLVKDDTETPHRFLERIAAVAPELQVDINQPYSAHDLNWTVDHNVVRRDLPHLAIELRQDHIATDAGAARMIETLARALSPML